MQKNSNRKGLALGAAFSLIATMFAGVAPAAANSTQLVITPAAGPITNFSGVLDEDFPLTGYTLPGTSTADFTDSRVLWRIEKTAGNMDVVAVATSQSASIDSFDLGTYATVLGKKSVALSNATGAPGNTLTSAANTGIVITGATSVASSSANVGVVNAPSSSLTVSGLVNDVTKVSHLTLRAFTSSPGITNSASPSVTVRVTMWVENLATANGTPDQLEWSTSQVVTLTNTNGIAAPATLGTVNTGDSVLTASATVGALNFSNLSGLFFLQILANGEYLPSTSTVSAAVSGATLTARGGVISQSFAVSGSAGVVERASFSIQVRYTTQSAVVDAGRALGSVVNAPAVATAASNLDLAVVATNDATQSAQTATVRANKTFTVRVGARTGSSNVSVSALAVEATLGGTITGGLAAGGKSISIDGVSTTSLAGKIALTTGTNGAATFTLGTSEFAGGETFTVTVRVGNISRSLTVNVAAATYELFADSTVVSAKPGSTATITYEVKDQWGVLATDANDLRVRFEKKAATGMTYTDTFSTVAVSAGKVSFLYTSGSATRSGSPTVEAQLQRAVAGTGGAFTNTGTLRSVTVIVSDRADAFSVSPVASQSASVSYFPSTVSYKTVTTTVVNGGAVVEFSGPSALIFRESGKTVTASGKLTVTAASTGVATVNVAALLEGTHTITIKVGDVSTTSLLVVDSVSASMGVRIVFDKTSIVSGETSTITGKLTDANGNAVDTTNEAAAGKAAVVVGWTGKGLPFQTGSAIETDDKGEFKVNVLALPGELGNGTITATYRPAGASVDAANVTATQVIAIVAPAAVAAPEISAVIGTFNGRWAVRVENAKGAVVSVKVGNRWVKYTSLNDNYLFSRKSRVGATLPVAVYVNGQLENVATITIK